MQTSRHPRLVVSLQNDDEKYPIDNEPLILLHMEGDIRREGVPTLHVQLTQLRGLNPSPWS